MRTHTCTTNPTAIEKSLHDMEDALHKEHEAAEQRVADWKLAFVMLSELWRQQQQQQEQQQQEQVQQVQQPHLSTTPVSLHVSVYIYLYLSIHIDIYIYLYI
jgi:hypothetical protein